MIQRQIPHGEGFKFGITRLDAPLMLMVQLAQAGGQFAAAGAWCGNHHQFPGGLDVVILAEAVLADNEACIVGITGDIIMVVDLHTQLFQPGTESLGCQLSIVAGQHHTGYIQTEIPENADQPDHIPVVGNAQVTPDLIFLNIVGVDGDDHLHLLLQCQQHLQLAVRLEAGQYPGGMIVVIQLTAEFQIQLAAELGNAVSDMLRLGLNIQVVIVTDCLHDRAPFQNQNSLLLYRIREKISSAFLSLAEAGL